nr:hypothetical protein [uncultured Brachyspira sp.]
MFFSGKRMIFHNPAIALKHIFVMIVCNMKNRF